MKEDYLAAKEFLYILPLSLALGASFASMQGGNWALGFISFSFLFLLSIVILKTAHAWSGAGKTLAYIIALAFLLRLMVGVTLHLGLPVFGHSDEDDQAGYVFTDAHKRDDQAWNLAISDRPIVDAFSRKYSSDQYGGLLAFNALIYRYFSSDAQRPLMLILFSAFFAALGIPFLWKAVSQVFGENVAWASAWIFALYPESILLGASAMREPYLLTFSTFALWGFVQRLTSTAALDAPHLKPPLSANIWLALGLLGMLLVSPVVALITIVILAGWMFFTKENHPISWKGILVIAGVFILGLFLLSSSLNRSGQFEATSPLHVINDWLRLAVKWDAYQLERDSGWVQKLFDEMPEWMRLPFVAIYGLLQPVLPATFMKPTRVIWKIIGILRAIGWYAMLPMLILSFKAAAGSSSAKIRSLILWLSLLTWTWVLFAALRGGGDLWDNPRYRTILFVWQVIVAGYTWAWWMQTRNAWFSRIVMMELVFLVIFTQWYGSRYYHWPGQLPFPVMVALIVGLWGILLGLGWWRDRRRA
jgi:hypothetical protein